MVSSTHMHGLAVYIKEGLSVACNLSLENSADSYLCFRLALLQSVSYFRLSRPTNLLIFLSLETNVNRKDWLNYSGGTD